MTTSVAAVLDAVAAAEPAIRRALATSRGETTAMVSAGENPSGDHAIAADDRVDALLHDRLTALDAVGAYASEERESVVDCGSGFSVTVDPVDGSSNLASNNLVGTVVGVYDAPLPAKGTSLVASAVVRYGPLTTMTVAHEGEATEWVVRDGERVAPSQVALPDEATVVGLDGVGTIDRTDDGMPASVLDLAGEVGLKLRYTGAMVADMGHLLANGGLLCYPEHEGRPNGVLRLQYESNPVAHIVECAGGAATDGRQRLLDREPGELHERVPTILGTPDLVDALTEN
ncbi:class 1 fructose-bisphosphatase [Haloarchaeobius sp. TZWSO28]|uniref:class 1 fructose-bisphosphatase n=1 Tax=Haloarchaeobius sp. TZWSO28 TaxID=3446119 RepID=UPI003EBDB654